jgi:hypothetical protein
VVTRAFVKCAVPLRGGLLRASRATPDHSRCTIEAGNQDGPWGPCIFLIGPGRGCSPPATFERRERGVVEVKAKLKGFGQVLVVDQPAAIGALVIAVARLLSIDVGYLPGLAMSRVADLHPGAGKTDARDAYIIAGAARTMPHTLLRVSTDDQTLAELGALAGYDDWTAQR